MSILQNYKKENFNVNLQSYMKQEAQKLNEKFNSEVVSTTHRALRIALYYGLIKESSPGDNFEKTVITDTFKEITSKCHGRYDNINLYNDVMQRQLEKVFIASPLDKQYKQERAGFRLFPVMLLYKVLLEIGRVDGNYSVSIEEYRYFIITTKKYSDFLKTLFLIKLFRNDPESQQVFLKIGRKFDNRVNVMLEQLSTLDIVHNNSISIKKQKIDEVSKKIYLFENNRSQDLGTEYLNFLGSKKSLFDREHNTELDVREKYESLNRLTTGKNVLLYGVPGSGKSWTIQHEYVTPDTKVERVVFHPDYTYSDFVGQILPVVKQNQSKGSEETSYVSYEFSPGPFTSVLKEAYKNPKSNYVLIIEEINRGNAPAIFGEIFQLLDRKVEYDSEMDDGYPIGTSEYSVTNADIANFVYGDKKHKVRIVSNLSIIGTMNTSDQNVFTLDTAFQRRWNMRLIANNFRDHTLANLHVLDTTITWKRFCLTINNIILNTGNQLASTEDKRLGVYFIHPTDLEYDNNEDNEVKSNPAQTEGLSEDSRLYNVARQHNRIFPEKVIKYLWDDAFKFSRDDLFKVDQYQSLESVINYFITARGNDRFNVFQDEVRKQLFLAGS